MAEATLEEARPPEGAAEGESWFRVRASPFEAEAYGGPPGRNWDRLDVLDDGYATYEWRSGADRVREAAQKIAAGKLTVDAALGLRIVGDYLHRQVELWVDSLEEGEVEAIDKILLQICTEILDGLGDPAAMAKPWSFYGLEEDGYLAEAADALAPLPPWARRQDIDDGGPGSGFDQPFVVLAPGFHLNDLRDYLLNGFGSDAG